MKRRIINRYVMAEILPGFLVNILVFTAIMLMARVMDLTSLVVARGVSAAAVFQILMMVGPKVLSMTIPMAALLAVLTAFLRLSADSELTVLRASGLSLYQLLPPVIVFGCVTAVLTALFTVWLAPEANWSFKNRLLALAKMRADLAIQEQVFVRNFPGLVLYVGQIETGTGELGQLFIQDLRSPDESAAIVAQRGRLGVDERNGVLLFHLEDGVIDRVYKGRPEANSVFFETYELKISPGSEFNQNEEDALTKGRSEMPTSELRAAAAQAEKPEHKNLYYMEWHRRLSFPVATLIMSIIGLPLGASFRARGRNFALIMGLAVFVMYYGLFSLGWSLAEVGTVSPAVGIWAANVLCAVLGFFIFRHAGRGMAVDPLELARRLMGLSRRGRISCPVKP